MAEETQNNKKDNTTGEQYSVSSGGRPPRTVTFQMPAMPDLRRHTNRMRSAGAGIIVAIILIAGLSGFAGAWIANHNTGIVTGSVSNEKKIVTSQSQLISQIAKTVGPSVVSVNVDISSGGSGSSSNSGFGLYGFSQPEEEQAAGTGIIISSDGLIVTNRHVVPAGTTNVSVTLSDGTELKNVSVVGRTSDSDTLDIAFLKINDAQGHKLPPAVLG
ncbi:MAG TPA: trypsin-like peptidase domain-containing protein, partial [Candidatus Saccharimonadales bacterium]|nr:trypsin-like peptidase domain-containing protein [Candidatus Saccharimonadales bacterium]